MFRFWFWLASLLAGAVLNNKFLLFSALELSLHVRELILTMVLGSVLSLVVDKIFFNSIRNLRRKKIGSKVNFLPQVLVDKIGIITSRVESFVRQHRNFTWLFLIFYRFVPFGREPILIASVNNVSDRTFLTCSSVGSVLYYLTLGSFVYYRKF